MNQSADIYNVPDNNGRSAVSTYELFKIGCVSYCSGPLYLALFIIGVCAAANSLSGIVAGGCAVGIGTVLLLAQLAVGRKVLGQDSTVTWVAGIIATLAFIVIGSLAIAGIMPAVASGYTILIIAAAALAIGGVKMYCCGGFKKMFELQAEMIRVLHHS